MYPLALQADMKYKPVEGGENENTTGGPVLTGKPGTMRPVVASSTGIASGKSPGQNGGQDTVALSMPSPIEAVDMLRAWYPQSVPLDAAGQSCASDGSRTCASMPSGDTQPRRAGTPPTRAIVSPVNGGNRRASKRARAATMMLVLPLMTRVNGASLLKLVLALLVRSTSSSTVPSTLVTTVGLLTASPIKQPGHAASNR